MLFRHRIRQLLPSFSSPSTLQPTSDESPPSPPRLLFINRFRRSIDQLSSSVHSSLFGSLSKSSTLGQSTTSNDQRSFLTVSQQPSWLFNLNQKRLPIFSRRKRVWVRHASKKDVFESKPSSTLYLKNLTDFSSPFRIEKISKFQPSYQSATSAKLNYKRTLSRNCTQKVRLQNSQQNVSSILLSQSSADRDDRMPIDSLNDVLNLVDDSDYDAACQPLDHAKASSFAATLLLIIYLAVLISVALLLLRVGYVALLRKLRAPLVGRTSTRSLRSSQAGGIGGPRVSGPSSGVGVTGAGSHSPYSAGTNSADGPTIASTGGLAAASAAIGLGLAALNGVSREPSRRSSSKVTLPDHPMMPVAKPFDRSCLAVPGTARILFGSEESALTSQMISTNEDQKESATHLQPPLRTVSQKKSRRKSHLTESEMRLLMAAKWCGRCQLQVTLTGSCGCPPRQHSRRYSSAAHHRSGK